MENNNFYDMTRVSKKTLEKNKRIEKGINESLTSYYSELKTSEEEKERKLNEAAMAGARFGYASTYARSKNRINNLNEEIRYQNDSAVVGMTEMVAEVVEDALLLDESEFAKYNPDYKEDIRDIISGFLKEGNINEEISNPDTLLLMEYIARTLPNTKNGINLTEDELANHIASNKNRDVNLSIKNLSGDVSARVASLVEAEQEKVDQINKEVNKAKKPEKEKESKDAADADEILQGLNDGKITEDDVEEALSNGEISQDVYDEVMNSLDDDFESNDITDESEEEMPAEDGSADNYEEVMEDDNAEVSHDSTATAGQPKKQIQMLPDGTLNLNIYESYLAEDSRTSIDVIDLAKQNKLKQGNAGIISSKVGNYDGEMLTAKALGVKSTLGLELTALVATSTIIGAPVGIVAALASLFRTHKNSDILASDHFKDLKEIVGKDPKCISILKGIRGELAKDKPNKDDLKHRKAEFFDRVKELKQRYSSENQKLTESLDIVLTNMALEETYKPIFICETPRCGLIESLAVNEAANMLKEGKEYDADACLANAIMYVTITEAMDEMGLMNVGKREYSKIISAAGGKTMLESFDENKHPNLGGTVYNIGIRREDAIHQAQDAARKFEESKKKMYKINDTDGKSQKKDKKKKMNNTYSKHKKS